jgi:Cu/Zn superoxide dismutase
VKDIAPFTVLAVVLTVAGCGSSGSKQGLDSFIPQVAGATAQLRSPSSAATGVVHVFDTKDGIQVQLFISNLQPGIHRIALHENANCKSPNLFSAGKPWAPPTFTGDAGNLLPGFIANESGNEHGYVAFVKGVSVDGPVSIRNRSVVIHWGNFTSEAMPGQPNNRVACGTFESNKPFL